MKKIIEIKLKHIKIVYRLFCGSIRLLSTFKMNAETAIKISKSFDDGGLAKNFLYSLTDYWTALETVEYLGKINIPSEIQPTAYRREETPSGFHAPLSGEHPDFSKVLLQTSPFDYQELLRFTGKAGKKN
jgi:hypothetical protein